MMRPNKPDRKLAEKILWEIYRRDKLRGGDEPLREWAMDYVFTDTFERGSSSWWNLYNMVKKEMTNGTGKGNAWITPM